MRKLILAAVLGVGVVASLASAQDDSGSSSPSRPGNAGAYHERDRALAFGAVALSRAGFHPSDWKKVEAVYGCAIPGPLPEPMPAPEPKPGQGDDDVASSTSVSSCWDVQVVTDYELYVCPNGEAYILRSGIGATNVTAYGASLYGWSEAVACEAGEPIGNEKPGDAQNAERPLDQARLRRSSL